MARPTRYNKEFNEIAYKLCLLGHTDAELGKYFGVNESTICRWKIAHPEFCKSIKSGKEIADAEVTQSLYKSAMGYEHSDTDIRVVNNEIVETPITKYYPPNATSIIFFLKNRQPKKWRDKQEIDHGGQSDNPINITQIIVENPHANGSDQD